MTEFVLSRELLGERDIVLAGLFLVASALAWHASGKAAQLQRILEEHTPHQWRRWVEDDEATQHAGGYRRFGMCPRGHGPLKAGICETCGFR
jgi:hypothetical protein